MSENAKFFISASIPFSVVVAVCYMSGYWWTFGVDVFSYINASDLILVSAVPLVGLGFFTVIGMFLGIYLSKKEGEHEISTVKGKVFRGASAAFDLFAGFLIITILVYGGDQKWQVVPVVLTLLTLSLARQAGLLDSLIKSYSRLNYVILFVVIYFPLQAYGHGKLKALNVISGKEYKQVIVPKLSESGDLRYIGKAGDRLFLWSSVEKGFHMLSISAFDQLIIRERKPNKSSNSDGDKAAAGS